METVLGAFDMHHAYCLYCTRFPLLLSTNLPLPLYAFVHSLLGQCFVLEQASSHWRPLLLFFVGSQVFHG